MISVDVLFLSFKNTVSQYIYYIRLVFVTYDHRLWKTGLPVRSAVLKPQVGMLVVGSVTTSESVLLYVFFFGFFLIQLSEAICFAPVLLRSRNGRHVEQREENGGPCGLKLILVYSVCVSRYCCIKKAAREEHDEKDRKAQHIRE